MDLCREKRNPRAEPWGPEGPPMPLGAERRNLFEGSLLFAFDSSPTRNEHRRNSIYFIGLSRGTFIEKLSLETHHGAHSFPGFGLGSQVEVC